MHNSTKTANRLINEKSPYLLQHAYNPVDWYPWCEEAFVKAKNEDKPIFLSIGYSTCHWCHVMEHECFEDDETAKALNNDFISIKVDKEERPDIDSIYMNVCQAIVGNGGWPLTILMTPDQKPFYAGTYLPKHSRYNIIGLLELLEEVKDKWQSEKNNIESLADNITEFIKNPRPPKNEMKPPDTAVNQCFEALHQSFDKHLGGFGSAPKFPMAHGLLFLTRYYKTQNIKPALEMTEKTLLQMYKGGIFDHIGFGFSRYSTDDKWLVPHFEKMLYDNALLIMAYSNAYAVTNNKIYCKIAGETIHYIFNELTNSKGGFYCAQDADSEGVEGKYYVFKPAEIKKVLGEAQGQRFNRIFDITEGGNFEGSSIPNLLLTGITNEDMEDSRNKLYDYRKSRYKLHLDDKVLTAWNGLMIAALAIAYSSFNNPQYLQAAKKAALFVKESLTEGNQVFTSYRDGKRSVTSFIDDYAFLIWGLIELYRVTFDNKYLEEAQGLMEKAIDEFYDEENGGFYLYGKSGEQLLIRPKETYDGAIPSGNSVMFYNLLALSKLTKTVSNLQYTNRQLEFMISQASGYPTGHCFFMFALLLYIDPPKEIVCVLSKPSDFEEIINHLPYDAFVQVLDKETTDYPLKDGKTTFYVCHNNHCLPPTNEL